MYYTINLTWRAASKILDFIYQKHAKWLHFVVKVRAIKNFSREDTPVTKVELVTSGHCKTTNSSKSSRVHIPEKPSSLKSISLSTNFAKPLNLFQNSTNGTGSIPYVLIWRCFSSCKDPSGNISKLNSTL